jgi:hypothetical protein
MALAHSIFIIEGDRIIYLIAFIAFLSLTLRVSYFVFYLVSYLKLEDKMKMNRTIETITEEDRNGDKFAYILQIIFNILYTWQDKLIYYIDRFCQPKNMNDEDTIKWYSGKFGLRLNNFIGLGTELTLLIIMTYANEVKLYFWINIIGLNFYLLLIILYRKFILSYKTSKQKR